MRILHDGDYVSPLVLLGVSVPFELHRSGVECQPLAGGLQRRACVPCLPQSRRVHVVAIEMRPGDSQEGISIGNFESLFLLLGIFTIVGRRLR